MPSWSEEGYPADGGPLCWFSRGSSPSALGIPDAFFISVIKHSAGSQALWRNGGFLLYVLGVAVSSLSARLLRDRISICSTYADVLFLSPYSLLSENIYLKRRKKRKR